MDAFNITPMLTQALQTVPLWGIVLGALGFWLKKSAEYRKEEKERWDRIEARIYNLEMAVAQSGLKDLKSETNSLKERAVGFDASIKALWRAVDPPMRKSDG
jgi:hypothetical protein